MTNLSYERYKLMQEEKMKTYNLNGYKVVVCCDVFERYVKKDIIWIDHTDDGKPIPMFCMYEGGTSKPIKNCPHCGREVEVL